MDRERLAAQEEIENTEDPVDRSDLVSQAEAEWCGSWVSPIDAHISHETWRRTLAAHMQPPADAAD